MPNITCGQCGFKPPWTQLCPIFNAEVQDTDTCPRATRHPTQCFLCRKALVSSKSAIIFNNKIYCTNCAQAIGKCHTCGHAAQCDFETNPIAIPKQIRQERRQGNMVSVTMVKNPDRIEKTCKKSCPCYDSSEGCLRENYMSCGAWLDPTGDKEE